MKPNICKSCPNFKENCVTQYTWVRDAKITFLAENPSWVSANAVNLSSPTKRGLAFQGSNGLMIKKLVGVIENNFTQLYRKPFKLSYNMAYAVGSSKKPTAEVGSICANLWQQQWLQNNSLSGKHVILAFGMQAVKSLGIKARKIADIRGAAINTTVLGRSVIVIPTFSLSHVQAKPGLLNIFMHDIKTAIKIAHFEDAVQPKTIEELSKNYIYPKTIDELSKLVDHIIEYTDREKQADAKAWPIAIDTETNTLHSYKPGAKVLMLSVAWDTGKSSAIMLDHPETPYSLDEARPLIQKLLACPKPKIFHNGKFDITMLEQAAGYTVTEVYWDTMLAEHFINEDSKGFYGLKVLAPLYMPEFSGYEDKLNAEFRKEEIQFEAAEDEDGSEENAADESVDQESEAWTIYRAFETGWAALDGKDKKGRTSCLKRWKAHAKKEGLPVPSVDTKKEDKGFENIDIKTLLPYAAADADATREICKFQFRKLGSMRQIDDAHRVMDSLYIAGARTLGRMENRGVKIDFDLLNQYDAKLTDILKETEDRIHDLATQDFNIDSNAQLGSILSGLNFDVSKLTAGGGTATGKDVVSKYQAAYAYAAEQPDFDAGHITDGGRLKFAENLLLYRSASKMKNSFLKNIKNFSAIDGRLHTNFHLNGTATGRLSSSRLNLQNLPLYMCRVLRGDTVIYPGFNVKALLIPNNDDELFFNLDVRGAELRILAYYTQDEALIKALTPDANGKSLDVHTFFMARIMNPGVTDDASIMVEYNKLKKRLSDGDNDLAAFRVAIKRTVFGTLYGAGARKIAAQLGEVTDEAVERATKIIQDLFAAFPTIKRYIDNTHQEVLTSAQVKTIFGRYRRFPSALISKQLLSAAKREAVNFKIQSSSSDIVLSQLCEVEKYIHEIGGSVLLTVHDSMAGSIKKENISKLKDFFSSHIVNSVKDKFPWLPVPFLFDLSVGKNYGSYVDVDNYLDSLNNEKVA